MNPEIIFSVCNMVAMLAWLILIIVPNWKHTRKLVQLGIIPLLLAIVYFYLIVVNIGSSEGGFDSLEGVSKLFQNPNLLLAGWIHYLAFDLWVGSWEVGDAIKHKIPHFLIVPCLVFTFFFGPVGLLMYILVRWMKTKTFVGHENF